MYFGVIIKSAICFNMHFSYIFLFSVVVHVVSGAIKDPTSLPPSPKSGLYKQFKCGLSDNLKTWSQSISLKIRCEKRSRILEFFDTPAECSDIRSSLPTARSYPGWNYNQPTFAEALYRRLAADIGTENVAVSPMSLGAMVAVLSYGAVGKTKREILQALRLTAIQLESHYNTIMKSLNLEVASPAKVITQLFLDQSFYPIESKFNSKLKGISGTQVGKANFKSKSEAELKRINDFVTQQTSGKIKDAVSKEAVNENTDILLLNVFCFDGKWGTQFKKNMGNFKVSERNIVQATYITQQEDYFFYKDVKEHEYKILELPHPSVTDVETQFSLIIILPDNFNGLAKLEEVITKDNAWLENFDITSSNSKVLVKPTIPGFTINTNVELKDTVNKIGINELFGDSANLNGVTTRNIKISALQQRVYIRVDADGNEASASTVEAGFDRSLDNSAKSFFADHPFAFALIQRNTKYVLAIGHVLIPKLDSKEEVD